MWATWLIAGAAVKNEFLVPPFTQTVAEFFGLFGEAFFWRSLGSSLLRTLAAFAVSFVLALGCACLSTVFKPFAAFMRPVTAFFRSLPTMAVLLIILVWLTKAAAPVAVAVLVLFPMIYSQLITGIESVDGGLLQMAEAYKIPLHRQIGSIYLPHIAPAAVEQTGANLSFGLKLIISAEVMASTYTAVGGMMQEAQAYLNLPRLAALTVFAVLCGIVIEVAFRLFSRLIIAKTGGEL